jgi:hypothetical protein
MEPEMTPEEFGKVVEPVLLEYFEHGDTGEVEVGIDISIEWSLTPTRAIFQLYHGVNEQI